MAVNNNDAIILVALVACIKFSINRPKQTKVIGRKPKVDARTPARPPGRRRLQHYNNPVFVENLVKTLKTIHTKMKYKMTNFN